jgi:hypothetical protein
LFYLSPDGTLMAAAIDAGAAVDAAVPEPLFQVTAAGSSVETHYDVTADGQRFLIGDVVRAPTRSPITVVLNWTAALKK